MQTRAVWADTVLLQLMITWLTVLQTWGSHHYIPFSNWLQTTFLLSCAKKNVVISWTIFWKKKDKKIPFILEWICNPSSGVCFLFGNPAEVRLSNTLKWNTWPTNSQFLFIFRKVWITWHFHFWGWKTTSPFLTQRAKTDFSSTKSLGCEDWKQPENVKSFLKLHQERKAKITLRTSSFPKRLRTDAKPTKTSGQWPQ